jgi:outer membrane protein insertion porin family
MGYGGKQMPFFKNFYLGGPGSVRGYYPNSLGPRDVNDLSIGGTRRVAGNIELFGPFPGNKEKSIRLSGFLDGGALYGPTDVPGSMGMRYSAGIGFTWLSPMGPLKFSYAMPLNSQPMDNVQKLQFTLGSMF